MTLSQSMDSVNNVPEEETEQEKCTRKRLKREKRKVREK
uniref:Uncharacterized protein n=1 Tax=Tetranychus urticae TaxID=32264 RepID=T1JRN4_TETUR